MEDNKETEKSWEKNIERKREREINNARVSFSKSIVSYPKKNNVKAYLYRSKSSLIFLSKQPLF